MTIAQSGALEVWAGINAIDLGRVEAGQPAQIAIDAFRPTLFHGLVRQIGLQPTVINNVTTYEVKIAVGTQDPRWRIGLPVNVLLSTILAHDATLVPLSAITTRDGRDVVRIVADKQCDRGIVDRPMVVKARNAQAAAVDGLPPGELIVATGSETIADGVRHTVPSTTSRQTPAWRRVAIAPVRLRRTSRSPARRPKACCNEWSACRRHRCETRTIFAAPPTASARIACDRF
jgi:hypothetical protein